MGDVADILGIGSKTGHGSLAEEASRLLGDKYKSGSKSIKKSKPKGMSRELFSLMGSDSITPAVVTNKTSGPAFKTKRFTAMHGKWIWAPFRNPARSDNKIFYHWVKTDMQNVEYSYARFNVKPEPMTYSDQEYESHLSDPLWTRSETDMLMNLCYRYDLRWPVIADRYDSIPTRSTEDLQARYYSLIVRLRDARSSHADSMKRVEAHTSFDIEYERIRRMQQDLLFRKTREDEAEEARLRDELKAIDNNIKKLKKTTKLTAGSEKGSSKNEQKQSQHGSAALSASSDASGSQPLPGVPCLQSTRLFAAEGGVGLSKSLVKKVQVLVKELLSVSDNLLPTRTVCDMFDQLRSSAVCLLTLQTGLAKKEREVAALKAQFPALLPGGSEVVVPHSLALPSSSELSLLAPSVLSAASLTAATTTAVTPSAGPPSKVASISTAQQASKQPRKSVSGTKRKAQAITPAVAVVGAAVAGAAVAAVVSATSTPSEPTESSALTGAAEAIDISVVPIVSQKHASKKMKK